MLSSSYRDLRDCAGSQDLSFGVHLMFDGYGCPESILNDINALEALLKRIPHDLEMHPICELVVVSVGPNNRKDPGGLSGFVMIAESHISLHTFPKRGFVTADVYSCQNDLDVDRLVQSFADLLGATSFDKYVQERGKRYPEVDIYQ